MKLRQGLPAAWLLFNGADPSIFRDYTAYRDAHRQQLRAYLEKFVIHATGN